VAGAVATVLLLLVLAARHQALGPDAHPEAVAPPVTHAASGAPGPRTHEALLYGRVTTEGGAVHEGRVRWGGGEEAFWGDAFNGVKDHNPWAVHVPPERLVERSPLEILGIEILERERRVELGRPFMARFGDIARIEAQGRDLRVTLKSGTVFALDRFEADDLADGVRVWDDGGGVADLDEWSIRAIELLPAPRSGADSARLHGTVRTRQGDFTGFVRWNRRACLGTDTLEGHAAGGELGARFDTIRSIARHAHDGALVTLRDGRELEVSGTATSAGAIAGSTWTSAATGACSSRGTRSSASTSARAAAGPATTTFRRAARSRDGSRRAPGDASPSVSSTTSTRARPPRPSTRPPGACTTRSPSA